MRCKAKDFDFWGVCYEREGKNEFKLPMEIQHEALVFLNA